MESQKQTSFTFEIDKFSEKEGFIQSPNFSSGGCDWFVSVHPKEHIVDDHLSLYLCVANPESLRLGWKRRASYSFVLLNQSGKELFRIDESCSLFCAQMKGYGRPKAVPLKKLQEKGFLEKNKLRVKVEVKVVEVVDEGDATANEMLDVKGFQVLYSQVKSVSRLFVKHPDFAVNFRPKNQFVKTTYMNILLNLIETLNKPPHSISETELSNAGSELNDLTEAGFKLDWLKTKLDEVSLERKKEYVRVQELEEQINNLTLELNTEKGKTDTCAAKFLSLEQTVSDLKYMEFNLEEELQKEKNESYTYAAKVMSLEQTVMNLKDEVFNLEDELNKEKGKSDTSAAKVLSLEQTVSEFEDEVSDLEDELNKEKGKQMKSDSSAAKVLSLEQTVSDLEDELNKEKDELVTFAAKVLWLEQTMSYLEDELNKEKDESVTFAAKVLSLEQTMSYLEDVLNKEKGKSNTCAARVFSLEQTVLNLRAELSKEKAAACSWEVLDYADLRHEK